jgi:hypothetical protein
MPIPRPRLHPAAPPSNAPPTEAERSARLIAASAAMLTALERCEHFLEEVLRSSSRFNDANTDDLLVSVKRASLKAREGI